MNQQNLKIFNFINTHIKIKSVIGRYIFALASANFLCGCSIFSGVTPIAITTTDRELFKTVDQQLIFNVPFIAYELNGKSVQVYKVAFDGTLNDVAHVGAGERETVIGHIKKSIIDVHYYRGPGMQNLYFMNWLDAVIGFTSADIAQEAKRDFFEQASKWLETDPNVEIRVFVTGFSRGAAIARHFMNIVEQDWSNSSVINADINNAPHFYALLYDTVSTGQMDRLQLSLPSSLDYLIHIVAKDEPRSFFMPIVDSEEDGNSVNTFNITNNFFSHRVNSLILPGAHSDIGASYPTGIGDIYRDISEKLLNQMGLLSKNCWETFTDPLLYGKHDSRGVWDSLSGSVAPNSDRSISRRYYPIHTQKLTEVRNAEINSRLSRLALANADRDSGMMSIRSEQPGLKLKVIREGQEIKVLDASQSEVSNFKFSIKDNVRQLISPTSSLVISDDIWKRLPEGKVAVLSYEILKVNDKTYLTTYVNDIHISTEIASIKSDLQGSSRENQCKHNADGNLESPIKVQIIRPLLTN